MKWIEVINYLCNVYNFVCYDFTVCNCACLDRTQDSQYSKNAVSKTAVLNNRSLKNRSTQKPQYSKTAVPKIWLLWKKKKVDNCQNFPNILSKSFYYLCVSRSWYTPKKRDNGLQNFTWCGLLSFFKAPKTLKIGLLWKYFWNTK